MKSIAVLSLIVVSLLGANPCRVQAGEDDLRSRDYHVRISIARGVESLAIKTSGTYRVLGTDGSLLYTIDPGEACRVDIVKGRPGGKRYRLVLKQLDPDQARTALSLARAAAEIHGMPAKALRFPARAEGERDRLLVTLGDFDTIEQARAYRTRLGEDEVHAIFEEKAPARGGRVMIRDSKGTVVAADPSMLRVVPVDVAESSIYVMAETRGANAQSNFDSARHYRGALLLAIDEEGSLAAVNDLWIEYYLYGVVAAEIGNFAPDEVLKAQAVVARSEAVAKIERGIVSSSGLYDFVDTSLAQAYHGKAMENDRVRAAVDATRGEVLVSGGRAIDAVYSHSCGGVVSSMSDMWDSVGEDYSERMFDRLGSRPEPDLRDRKAAHAVTSRAIDALCNPDQKQFPKYARGHFRWEKKLTTAELSQIVDGLYGTGRLRDVIVTRRSRSGRVRAIRFVGADKEVIVDRELKIRAALGGIKSTFFTCTLEKGRRGRLEAITIHGAGFGHGVGLCQMGAYMIAQRGYNYRQILSHYFRKVKMRRLYA